MTVLGASRMPASAASLGLDLAVVRRRAISTWRTRLLLLCAVQIVGMTPLPVRAHL